jgi:hypothetical protein
MSFSTRCKDHDDNKRLQGLERLLAPVVSEDIGWSSVACVEGSGWCVDSHITLLVVLVLRFRTMRPRSDRSAKANRSMRRLLNQLAHAAVGKEDCQLQIVFRRLASRLGYAKAVWAIAHRLGRLIWKVLYDGVTYLEDGPARTPLALRRRRQRLVSQLKKLGYRVQLIPTRLDPTSL